MTGRSPTLQHVTESRHAVVVDGLSKSFRVPHEQVHTLKERALHPFRAHRDQRSSRR